MMNRDNSDQSRCKLLIIDDQQPHAEAIKSRLLSVDPGGWATAGAPENFHVDPEDVEVRVSSAKLIEDLCGGSPCPYDVVICDINMGLNRDEGALAVFRALDDATLTPSPCLLAMTQFAKDHDPRRLEIERRADDPRTSVPCIVISKYKALPEVHDNELQLDPLHWRDLVLRAIIHRREHGRLKGVRRDAALRSGVEQLGPFRLAFRSAHDLRHRPVVVLVSERYGLQVTLADAFGRKVKPLKIPGLSGNVERALFGGFANLEELREDSALLLLDADEFLRDAILSPGVLRQRLALLNGFRQVAVTPDMSGDGTPFCGLLMLSITPKTDSELSEDDVYRTFARVTLPAFDQVKEQISPLLDQLLKIYELRVDDLDRSVMAAYDWSLGFPTEIGDKGFGALRECLKWASARAEDHDVPSGLVANELTQSEQGRESVYAHLEREALLLYILDRLEHEYGKTAALSAAAFLYYRTVCTAPPSPARQAEKDKVLKRLWAQDGPFSLLRRLGKGEVKAAVAAAERSWPDRTTLTDEDLYGAKASKDAYRNHRPTADKMLDLLKTDFRKLLRPSQSAATYQNAIQRRIAEHVDRLGKPGRSTGARQLAVLQAPYLSRT